MKKLKSLLSIALIALMAIGVQIGTLGVAHAAGTVDVDLDARMVYA